MSSFSIIALFNHPISDSTHLHSLSPFLPSHPTALSFHPTPPHPQARAVQALCGVFIGCPRLMLLSQDCGLLTRVMGAEFPEIVHERLLQVGAGWGDVVVWCGVVWCGVVWCVVVVIFSLWS